MSKQLKEINRVSFEIEHCRGNTYFAFMLSIKEDGSVEVIQDMICSVADVDGDYIFESDNDLIRVQADAPITEKDFEDSWKDYEYNTENQ